MIEQTAIQENLLTTTQNKKPFASLTKITVIARNAFREAVRDRVLYNLVLFVLLITGAAIFLGEITAGQEARVITNLGLTAMLVFGAFISIFVGIGLVSKEIEKRTVFAIFAKPVGRGEFLIGKYLGLCLTLAVNTIVMGTGLTLALVYVGSASLAVSVWSAVFLIFLELTILTAVAILFSSFSSPALSALLTFLVFVIGHSSAALKDMAENLGTNAAQIFFNTLYYVLPNLAHFSFVTAAANGKIPSANHFFGAIAYALVYVSILLAASVLIFSRRNFK
jgi:ABC-type transport system involved in multi-copper enzyme maturation permease subunit